MKKRISKSRSIKEFHHPVLDDIKDRLKKDPTLVQRFKDDFQGTIRDLGIVYGDKEKNKLKRDWQKCVREDLRNKMEGVPKDKIPYYSMVRNGKPISIRVFLTTDGKVRKIQPREDEI